jgi:hypothetical protein
VGARAGRRGRKPGRRERRRKGTVDGVHPFSQVGLSVSRSTDGFVQGGFQLPHGRGIGVPGFTLMAVRGQVTNAAISGSTTTFDSAGMFQTGNQGKVPATFQVVVTEGGPGVGMLQLTLRTPFIFVLPTEHVLNGQISIH